MADSPLPTEVNAAAANAAYRAANNLPVDIQNTTILSRPESVQYLAQQDAASEAQKHYEAFSQPRNDSVAPSAAFLAIQSQYENRYGVLSSGGSFAAQPVSSSVNPYNPESAAGIAWEVARTGGATDTRLNQIATAEIRSVGGDPGFIRYATDIYQERPSFAGEVLTTKTGEQFYNPPWAGVPIRENLTLAEMQAGGGVDTSGKFYQYNPDTFMLEKITAPVSIGVDTGVHTRFGDFGGPILASDGSYGGWRPPSAVSRVETGSQVSAWYPERTLVGEQSTLPAPFRSTYQPPQESNEYKPSGFLGLGGLLPDFGSPEKQQAYATSVKSSPVESTLSNLGAGVGGAYSAGAGATNAIVEGVTFGIVPTVFKTEPIVIKGTPVQYSEVTSTTVTGGSPELTKLGADIETSRKSLDLYNPAAVAEYNKKVDLYNEMQKANPTIEKSVTTKSPIAGTGTVDKVYASEWDRFVEGSGRVSRSLLGFNEKQYEAYGTTIKSTPGIEGVAQRTVYEAGGVISNRPASLAPDVIAGATFVLGGEVIGAGVAGVAAGTSRAAPAAQWIVSPTGQTVVKAGAASFFGTLYGLSVTEGLTATPQKTEQNIERSVLPLAAMYAGGGGFNRLPEVGVKGLQAAERILPDIQQGPVRGQPVSYAGPQLTIKDIPTEAELRPRTITGEKPEFTLREFAEQRAARTAARIETVPEPRAPLEIKTAAELFPSERVIGQKPAVTLRELAEARVARGAGIGLEPREVARVEMPSVVKSVPTERVVTPVEPFRSPSYKSATASFESARTAEPYTSPMMERVLPETTRKVSTIYAEPKLLNIPTELEVKGVRPQNVYRVPETGSFSGEIEIERERGGRVKEKEKLSEFEIRQQEREKAAREYEKEREAFERQIEPEKTKEKTVEKEKQKERERYINPFETERVKQNVQIRETQRTRERELEKERLKLTELESLKVREREMFANPAEKEREREREREKYFSPEHEIVSVREREKYFEPREVERVKVTEREQERVKQKEITTPREFEIVREKPIVAPIPPVIPLPGLPWGGAGGGSGGSLRRRGPRKTEIFTYAPANLKGLFGSQVKRRK